MTNDRSKWKRKKTNIKHGLIYLPSTWAYRFLVGISSLAVLRSHNRSSRNSDLTKYSLTCHAVFWASENFLVLPLRFYDMLDYMPLDYSIVYILYDIPILTCVVFWSTYNFSILDYSLDCQMMHLKKKEPHILIVTFCQEC